MSSSPQPNNQKAVLDTSVFADLSLKSDDKNAAAKRAIAKYTDILLFEYMLKEFKQGPLTNFVWLYEKFRETQSHLQTLDKLHRMSRTPRNYRTSTAIEAYKEAYKLLDRVGMGPILAASAQGDSQDKALADFLGVEIKRIALNAWNKRGSVGTVTNHLPCYELKDIPAQNGSIDLRPTACSRGARCCVHLEMTANKVRLRQIQEGLKSAPEKRETSKRRVVVKKMINRPNDPLDKEECRQIGDAYFVFAAPAGSAVLTTNVKDMEPLGRACAVEVHSSV
ncbi:hypothetical protein RFM26_00700 [Mesorhizobium sp. VK23B]|uniref:PIN domain-containing protein n=1 Tax=Mesorhizobium dulcispinae TaxID=3072316 RepID=A0ABU4X814_9HYPH|nr:MULTISPECIES: hypothetical protein [unclassified Mesorhizobium]MDX8464212.1 hypothetical protein [Mesorhizobium sp. VK23B]MDX8470598.1 hypothetical protein [Mesorhizobium sp. VK23A]